MVNTHDASDVDVDELNGCLFRSGSGSFAPVIELEGCQSSSCNEAVNVCEGERGWVKVNGTAAASLHRYSSLRTTVTVQRL